MRANHFASAVLTVILGAAASATGCSAAGTEAGQTTDQADTTSAWWSSTRAARQATLDAYVAANASNFAAFKNAPLGDAGIPMIMLRLFPEIFPDIWGPSSSYMASVGFAQDPYEPTRVLPLGLGYTG